MLKKSTWIITSLLIAVPFMVYGLVIWWQNKFDQLPVYGPSARNASGRNLYHEIDKFTMINQNNQLITRESLKDEIIVVNFFFTSCPGVCSNMMDHMKKVQMSFPDDGRLAFISFSVDPTRDQPERLRWYKEKHQISQKNWSLLTGDKKEIYRLARTGFFLTASAGDGGTNDFIHSDQLVLIDKHRHIRGYYEGTNDQSIEKLIHDIKKLENED